MRLCNFLLLLLLLVPAAQAAELSDLHDEISKVCPVVGISGDTNRPDKIRLDLAPEATQEQKNAAKALRDAWNPAEDGKKDVDAKIEALLNQAANSDLVDDSTFQSALALQARSKRVDSTSAKKEILGRLKTLLGK